MHPKTFGETLLVNLGTDQMHVAKRMGSKRTGKIRTNPGNDAATMRMGYPGLRLRSVCKRLKLFMQSATYGKG